MADPSVPVSSIPPSPTPPNRYLASFLIVCFALTLACGLPTWFFAPSPIPPNTPAPTLADTQTPTQAQTGLQATVDNPPKLNLLDLRQGELRFLVNQATASEPGAKPSQGCWPTSYYDDGGGFLRAAPDGKLTGTCAWKTPNKKNALVTWNTTGALNGDLDPKTGRLVFHLQTSAEYPRLHTTILVSFEGNGSFTTPLHAEGIATFTSTCASSSTEEGSCGTEPTDQTKRRSVWNITGSVPWTLDFSP